MNPSRTEWIIFRRYLWKVHLPPVPLSAWLVAPCQLRMVRTDLIVRLLVQEAVRVLLPQDVCSAMDVFTHPVYQGLITCASQLRENDPDLYEHSLRVLLMTWRFVHTLVLPKELSFLIRLAALFHDLGKLSLPKDLLYKSSALTPHEWRDMKQHVVRGAKPLLSLSSLQLVSMMIFHHHERWDGAGYPTGLRGIHIPLGSRIIAITDAFAVMTEGRSYQPPRDQASALAELARCAESQFDPLLVALFSQVAHAGLLFLNDPGDSPFRATS